MANAGDPEVKAGFTFRYFLFTALISILTGAIGFVSSYLLQIATKESKEVLVSMLSSGNLATVPISAANNIEVYLSLPNNQRQAVKSLFKYDATITNISEEGIDDFIVFVTVPPFISLAGQPQVTSDPPAIKDTIKNEPIERTPNRQVFRVSLLNQGQSLTYSYFAYADNVVESVLPAVTVQKKDWTQTVVHQAPVTAGGGHPVVDILGKLSAQPWALAAFLLGFLAYFVVVSRFFTVARRALPR